MSSVLNVSRSGETVLVRWSGLPTSLDFHELRRCLLLARHLVGGPVKFIAVVPESVPPFLAPDTQQTVLAMGPELFDQCASVDFVVEGSSQHRRQLLRVLRAFAESVTISVQPRIHATLEEALEASGTPLPFEPVPMTLPQHPTATKHR